MDDEIIQIFTFINWYLQNDLNSMNIGNMKWKTLNNSFQDVPKTNKYDNFKLKDFLILYKINRLASLNIINDKIANKLNDLFYLKKTLESTLEFMISEKNIDINKDTIDKICKKIIKIEEKLKKYNLTNITFDLAKIIDNDINLSKKQLEIYNQLVNQEDDNINKTIDYLDIKIAEKNNKIK